MFGWAAGALAEPAPLVVNTSKSGRASVDTISAVHLEIPTGTTDLKKIRLGIVDGMMLTKGRVWTYEGEGDGYILARFDYRGLIIVIRIEYDQDLVQLKYYRASKGLECSNLQPDGICYKNHRNYYNYTKNLRASIIRQLRVVSGGVTT